MNNVSGGPFKGENNRLPDFALSGKEWAFVRSAINVDLSEAGTFKRRPGSAKVVSGTDCHSLWATGEDSYYVDHRTLFHLSSDYTATAVLTGLTPSRVMSYADAGVGRVFCTNKPRKPRPWAKRTLGTTYPNTRRQIAAK